MNEVMLPEWLTKLVGTGVILWFVKNGFDFWKFSIGSGERRKGIVGDFLDIKEEIKKSHEHLVRILEHQVEESRIQNKILERQNSIFQAFEVQANRIEKQSLDHIKWMEERANKESVLIQQIHEKVSQRG